MNKHKDLSGDGIISVIQDELNVFSAANVQPDDITMMMIKFKE